MHVNHTRSSVNVPIWITRCRILSAIEKGGLSRVAQRKFQSRTQCHFGSLLTVWSPNNECLFGQGRSCMGNYYGHYLRYLATKPLTRSQNDPGLEIAKFFHSTQASLQYIRVLFLSTFVVFISLSFWVCPCLNTEITTTSFIVQLNHLQPDEPKRVLKSYPRTTRKVTWRAEASRK